VSRRSVRAAGVCVALLLGCANRHGPSDGSRPDPVVVVTTSILGDVVEEVAAGEVDVVVLMPPGADPHSFALTAAQASRLGDADLVIANGLGLETMLDDHLRSARAAGIEVLEIGPHLDPVAAGPGLGPDPHVWTDPRRMQRAVDTIAEAIGGLGHVDRGEVAAAAQRYRSALRSMEASMAARFAVIPPERRLLVTNHHVFGYFAERFGFRVIGAVVPSATTLASPSAADLEALVQVLREAGVPAIFADTSQPTRLADAVASEAHIDVDVVELHTESLGPPSSEAATYLGMLDSNADTIVDALT